jgi:peptidoglycan L-alanyl-D-glutamate endopeptidase CwlK
MIMKEDKTTIQRIKLMHPFVIEEVMTIYKHICAAMPENTLCRFTDTYRSFEEQDALYAIGRTVQTNQYPVTNARGGKSYHNYGLAFDITLLRQTTPKRGFALDYDVHKDSNHNGKPEWMEIVKIAKTYGWAWGGDWKKKDYPHFERSFGFTCAELKQRLLDKDLLPGQKFPALDPISPGSSKC